MKSITYRLRPGKMRHNFGVMDEPPMWPQDFDIDAIEVTAGTTTLHDLQKFIYDFKTQYPPSIELEAVLMPPRDYLQLCAELAYHVGGDHWGRFVKLEDVTVIGVEVRPALIPEPAYQVRPKDVPCFIYDQLRDEKQEDRDVGE